MSLSSRQCEVEPMELENLIAKYEEQEQLRDPKCWLQNDREVIELRLKQQRQELLLQEVGREHEQERKKAEADEEQRLPMLELTKGGSRASRSVAAEIEKVGSKRHQEKMEG